MMKTVKKITRTLFLIALSSLLAGCELSVLNPKGIIAEKEVHIMLISAALMLIVVIPVVILTLFFSWRYRENNTKANYMPEWAHSTMLEVIWWSIPCIIIAILGAITWTSSHTLDPYRPLSEVGKSKTLTIQAIALEWKWLFIYPEQNIATVNEIQIPVNVPIRFEITSEGPMNSFLIPQLAGQIYAMAGMKTKLHLIANELGMYQGFSANFSGKEFSAMNFPVRVSTQNDFEQWVLNVKKSRCSLDKHKYDQLLVPGVIDQKIYFSEVDKNIFEMSIMKYMMPEKELANCHEKNHKLS